MSALLWGYLKTALPFDSLMNKLKRHILILGALIPAVTMSAAPAISIKASADSTVMLMGDRNLLHVSVDMPSDSPVQLLDFPVLAPGTEYIPFNGVDVVASDSSSVIENGRRKIDFTFTIQAFDPGTLTIPPFAALPSQSGDTAFSNIVTLKVLPVDVDSLETINPMESIVEPGSRWYDYIPGWLLWVLAAVAAVVAAFFCIKFFRKAKETVELRRNPPVPPYELAISRLNTLRSRNLAESGHEKEYYTELVDILRQYLEGRFGIYAMEMTSSQIVKALRSNPATRMTADEVRQVLSIADFVKFAKVRPLTDDNIKAFARASAFVEQTKPAPEPEAEAENAGENTPQTTPKTKN